MQPATSFVAVLPAACTSSPVITAAEGTFAACANPAPQYAFSSGNCPSGKIGGLTAQCQLDGTWDVFSTCAPGKPPQHSCPCVVTQMCPIVLCTAITTAAELKPCACTNAAAAASDLARLQVFPLFERTGSRVECSLPPATPCCCAACSLHQHPCV